MSKQESLPKSEYQDTGISIGKLSVYKAMGIETLHFLDLDAVNVETADTALIKRGQIGVSYGANPCIIVVSEGNFRHTALMHSVGESFSDEEVKLIERSKRGIAVGSMSQLKSYRAYLERHGIVAILPPNDNYSGNIAVVKQTSKLYPKGVFYTYDFNWED